MHPTETNLQKCTIYIISTPHTIDAHYIHNPTDTYSHTKHVLCWVTSKVITVRLGQTSDHLMCCLVHTHDSSSNMVHYLGLKDWLYRCGSISSDIFVLCFPQSPQLTYQFATGTANQDRFFIDTQGKIFLRRTEVGRTGDPYTVSHVKHTGSLINISSNFCVSDSMCLLTIYDEMGWIYNRVMRWRESRANRRKEGSTTLK